MINLAGLGEAIAGGDPVGVGESAGVVAVLGVTADVDGVAGGETVCWLVCGTQAASIKTHPATIAAGTTPLIPKSFCTCCGAECRAAWLNPTRLTKESWSAG
jgi:hypothetical protein